MKPYTKVHKFRGYINRLRRLAAPKSASLFRLSSGLHFVHLPGNELSELIYMGRAYEPVETEFATRFLQRGDVAIDIGANIGYFTALFSNAVGRDGRVIALEPGPTTFSHLITVVERLKLSNVYPIPMAAWKENSVLTFNSSVSGADAQQSFFEREKTRGNTRPIPVAGVTLETLMNAEWAIGLSTPTLIKLDVEGAEPQAWHGMKPLLEGKWRDDSPVFMVEFNHESLTAAGHSPLLFLSDLQETFDLYATALVWPPWHTTARGFLPIEHFDVQAAACELNLLCIPKSGKNRDWAKLCLETTSGR